MGEKIGEGANAEVFAVENDLKYAMKICPPPTGKGKGTKSREAKMRVNSIYWESQLYNGVLVGFTKAPSRPCSSYGEDHGYRYIVLERLEFDLMKLADETVSVAQIAKIGIEVLEGFQELHTRKYCFVYVKPDNFMIKGDELYFIDFGLIEKYVDISTGEHRPLQTSVQLVGTPTFSSLNRHAGYNHSRRDDIEAICYMLLSLCSRGKLPWSVATSDSELHEMKKGCEILSFCKKNGCDEIGEMIMKARAIDYDSEPNYEEFGSLLKKMATGGAKRKISSNSFDSSSGGKKVAKNHVKKAITGSKLSNATKDCRESNMNGSVGKKSVSTLGAQKKMDRRKKKIKK